jgi:5-methylcytosine-specific restriction endonuclease McrA
VKKKKTIKRKVERPRNDGAWTESQYWQQIRNCLRKAFQYWKPMMKALEKAKRPSKSSNAKLKWEYLCNSCSQWFPRKGVQIDHIIECGRLKAFEDLEGFITRLTPEDPDSYQILCIDCHKQKTKDYRNNV